MAHYHFSLKKDVRPDGKQILSASHIEYITRTGRYKDRDNLPDNLISGTGKPKLLDGKPMLLYTSPYGNIKLTPDGINVTAGASPTTVSVALMIAQEIFHADLRIQGSEKFKKLAAESAAEFDLPIQFESKKLNILCREQKRNYEIGRRKSERANGTIREKFIINQSDNFVHGGGLTLQNFSASYPDAFANCAKLARQKPFTVSCPDLRKLPSLNAAAGKSEQSAMPLLGGKNDSLDCGGENSDLAARWANLSGKRKYATATAEKIVRNVEKFYDHMQAASHVEYINRQVAFAKKGGCVYTDHRLPKWADSDPRKFFLYADKYESAKNVRYREFEISVSCKMKLNS